MVGPFSTIQWLNAAWYERRALRDSRSDGRYLGESWADFAWQTVVMLRDIWLIRLGFAAIAVSAAILLHFHFATMCLVIAMSVIVSDKRLWWLLFAAGCVAIEYREWSTAAIYAAALWTLFETLTICRMARLMRPAKPYACIVFSRWDRIRNPRMWLRLAPVLDAAFSKNARFARDFLARSGQLSRSRWTAVEVAVLALTEARLSSLADGLQRIHVAERLDAEGDQHRGSTGLIMLARAEVLLTGSRLQEALNAYQAALSEMRRNTECAAVVHAEKRIIECLYGLGSDSDALTALARLRHTAARRNDLLLLKWTETYAAAHMLRVGNFEGAAESVPYIAEGRLDSSNVLDTPDDHIVRHLTVAAIVAKAKQRGLTARYGDLVESSIDSDQVELALSRLADNPYARYSVVAYTYWALIERAENGDSPVVLRRLLMALRHSERLRVTMPASAWREGWVEPLEFVYLQALNVAHALQDAETTLELIELARALPDPQTRRRQDPVLALLQAAIGVVNDSDGEQQQALADPTSLRVGGYSGIRSSNARSVELTDAMLKVAEYPCYLTAAVVANEVFWAFLLPNAQTIESGIAAGRYSLESPQVLDTLTELFGALPALSNSDDRSDDLPAYYCGPLMTDTGPTGGDREYDLLRRVSEIVLRPLVVEFLMAASAAKRPALILGASGFLNAIPWAGLPVPGDPAETPLYARRLVEVVDIIHVPSWGSVCREATGFDADRTAPRGLAMAVVAPDPKHPLLSNVSLPTDVTVLRTDVSKKSLREHLQAIDWRADSSVYISCHGGSSPSLQGLKFADADLLTAADLMSWAADDAERRPLPSRIYISACESFGGFGTDLAQQLIVDRAIGITNSREWWGLPIAALSLGAVHTAVTRYPVDVGYANEFDAGVLPAFTTSETPWAALSEAQVKFLDNWRRGVDVQPMTWQSYCYVGYGRRKPYSWRESIECFDGN